MESDQREDEALSPSASSQTWQRNGSHLQILYKIIEHPQPFRIRTIVHVCQRADLCCLTNISRRFHNTYQTKTDFERDVLFI